MTMHDDTEYAPYHPPRRAPMHGIAVVGLDPRGDSLAARIAARRDDDAPMLRVHRAHRSPCGCIHDTEQGEYVYACPPHMQGLRHRSIILLARRRDAIYRHAREATARLAAWRAFVDDAQRGHVLDVWVDTDDDATPLAYRTARYSV